jgi:hypothetical protein
MKNKTTNYGACLPSVNASTLAMSWCMGLAMLMGVVLALQPTPAQAQVSVGATISGEIVPGVYGRIDIGHAPPPRLIYAQPVIIRPTHVHYEPLYLYVPPGHAKKWSKHCVRYNACNRPVYFVQEPARHSGGHEDHHDERKSYKNKGKGKDHGHHD